ncbi:MULTISPECIES: BLUF domain-containing protein [unclassified Colwellia]|uniref:BLUF domain-containing protein n=1 Tax=unclassified Colwellia TaxID=196834 RepID=UPI0015F429FA|nr:MULTISPECIES: BLUF domain-containing protein [unclassified Colwellia]MBA6224181.1 BLUF domain-containing protein [Colwellia sp. MB3u-45]MBA6268311.1 BLUF domain-containing protein [Colwellia sp. MB3u-43]MBA6288300.1 BLUF domain-containing protein [Colwellia sp. MB3u-4]MBA6322737.1 BLUF domain-containing protein [Colwellia sp. MB02u-19]MBA6323513.1 BLUF domain-containing protein [Colwellia sp. MB02u-18]
MFELLYTSISPAGLSEVELMGMLKQWRLKNQALDITGMLLYHDREIMQILEGEEDKVKALFQTILMDNRHRSIEVIYEGNIKDRAFGEWSMAFKLLDENIIKMISAGYEEFNLKMSPITMIKENPNRGKKTFLSLRDML